MPAYIDFTTLRKNAALDAALDVLNGGTVELRTGASPGANNSATGTLLATITLNNPAFAAAAGGEKALNAPPSATAVADGTVGYARFLTSGSVVNHDIKAGGSFLFNSVDTGTDTITLNANHGLAANDEVEVFVPSGGSLPGGLAIRTTYYVRNPSGATLQLSATPGGAAIDLTSGFASPVRLKRADVGVAVSSYNGSITTGNAVSIVSYIARM
jgi:hypothetical protein